VSGATGTGGNGGPIDLQAGPGSASSHASVDGTDGAFARLDAGPGGAGTGGEGGSASGVGGPLLLGDVYATTVDLGLVASDVRIGGALAGGVAGNTDVQVRGQLSVGHATAPADALALDIPRGNAGTVPPKAFGLPALTTTERDALSSPPARACVYNTTTQRVEVYDGSSWIEQLTPKGFTVTGTIKQVQNLVAFSATPSVDISLHDHWFLGTLTGNVALTLANPALGNRGRIELLQDGVGNHRITGITVAGFTVLVKNASGLLNTAAMKAANARTTLYYELALVNITGVCHVWTETGVTPDYT
jgi:hypothetical protein